MYGILLLLLRQCLHCFPSYTNNFFQAFPMHMKETKCGSANLFESKVTAQRNVVTLHECLPNRRTKLADGAGEEERKPPQKGPPPPLQPPPEARPPPPGKSQEQSE